MLISSFAKFLPRLLGNWAGSGQSESFLNRQLCNHESQGDIYSLIIIFQDTAVKWSLSSEHVYMLRDGGEGAESL